VIPAMTNDVERRQSRRQRRTLAVATSALVAIVGFAAIAWRLRLIQDWIR
jgi:hypothetical protein